MGVLSDIYDAFATLTSGALAGYARIPNPYMPDDASDLVLTKGYGITLGAGREVGISLGYERGRERTVNVLLIRAMTALESDGEAHAVVEKAILEDMLAVEYAVERDNGLGGLVLKIDYESDTGIQFAYGEKGRFVAASIDFLITYEESIT